MTAISRHKIFVKIVMLCASILTLSSGSDLFCDCLWLGPFMVAADGIAPVIVHAKILGYNNKNNQDLFTDVEEINIQNSYTDVEVIEVLKGIVPNKRIVVLAGGLMVERSLAGFPINTEWILALEKESQGYRIPTCGPEELNVKDGNVSGNITNLHHGAKQEMPLSEFKTILKEAVTPSMPKAWIRLPGSAKLDMKEKGATPPVLLESPAPPYPEEVKKRNIDGDIFVHAIVRKDGTVDKIRVIGSADRDLDESVVNTIASKWRFAPGTVSGMPVDIRTIIKYSFRLESPLRVVILDNHWDLEFGKEPSTIGVGNLIENGSVRGFEFTTKISEFGNREYPAFWKESQYLEIRDYDQITGQPHLYKLHVKMKDFMYQIKDGALITLPIGIVEQTN
jgi:TonB family protein